MSRAPLRSRSTRTTRLGAKPTSRSRISLKFPMSGSNGLTSTETVSDEKFTTTASDRPSPVTSPLVTPEGSSPTPTKSAASKPPLPSPTSTETPLSSSSEVTKSRLPSPLTSAAVIPEGVNPTAWIVSAPNVPSPLFRSTETSLEGRVGHGEIGEGVVVEVSRHDLPRLLTDGVGVVEREVAGARVEQHRDGVGVFVGRRHVDGAVEVEVGARQRDRAGATGVEELDRRETGRLRLRHRGGGHRHDERHQRQRRSTLYDPYDGASHRSPQSSAHLRVTDCRAGG